MAVQKPFYPWPEAFEVANALRQRLEPHCERIMIAGSLRRQCEIVHDIDIVLQPLPSGELSPEHLMFRFNVDRIIGDGWQWKRGGAKIVSGQYHGISVDLYLATREQWWTLVVIRTGSREHNIRLCQRAHELVAILHADGSGLQKPDGSFYTPKSEEDLFGVLELDYVEPKDRG
jgi:DNA polymerase (family 10)